MIKEVTDFKRKELFDHYHEGESPFVMVTTKIAITNVVNYCKVHKNMYATIGYLIAKTVNEIDAFKYRYKDGKIYYCDPIKPNFTDMYEDKTIGFFGFEYEDNYDKFISKYKTSHQEFLDKKELITNNRIDEIWFSCSPWFKFTSLIVPFNREVTIPQFIWDKYELDEDRYYINLMVMVHHGFADGYHIGAFIQNLNKHISEFK